VTNTQERTHIDLREDYLSKIVEADKELNDLEQEYKAKRKLKKSKFVNAVLEAQHNDVTMPEIVNKLGKSRQAIYKWIKEIRGVRYPEMNRYQ
jgi:predicted DNA-binding protein YlxM (UPF0122 family)